MKLTKRQCHALHDLPRLRQAGQQPVNSSHVISSRSTDLQLYVFLQCVAMCMYHSSKSQATQPEPRTQNMCSHLKISECRRPVRNQDGIRERRRRLGRGPARRRQVREEARQRRLGRRVRQRERSVILWGCL